MRPILFSRETMQNAMILFADIVKIYHYKNHTQEGKATNTPNALPGTNSVSPALRLDIVIIAGR
jgi:hypothetical protein